MFDSNPELHRCRNPRCKTRLKEPAQNRRDAFCCASCEVGFYRTHCRVCERPITGKNTRRELCGRRQCRNQFRSFRTLFFSVWYPSARRASKPEKSSAKSTLKTGIKSDRRWRQIAGPALSASAFHCAIVGADEVLRRNALQAHFDKLDGTAIDHCFVCRREDDLVDFKAADGQWVTTCREHRTSPTATPGATPSDWRPCLPSDWKTLPDLPIPALLRRRAQ